MSNVAFSIPAFYIRIGLASAPTAATQKGYGSKLGNEETLGIRSVYEN